MKEAVTNRKDASVEGGGEMETHRARQRAQRLRAETDTEIHIAERWGDSHRHPGQPHSGEGRALGGKRQGGEQEKRG